jgi:hypothetical protein
VIPFSSIRGLHLYNNDKGDHMAVGRWGFLAVDISAPPTFQTRRVICSARKKNQWRDRSDFTANKQATTGQSASSRYYLFGKYDELATLVAMLFGDPTLRSGKIHPLKKLWRYL